MARSANFERKKKKTTEKEEKMEGGGETKRQRQTSDDRVHEVCILQSESLKFATTTVSTGVKNSRSASLIRSVHYPPQKKK